MTVVLKKDYSNLKFGSFHFNFSYRAIESTAMFVFESSMRQVVGVLTGNCKVLGC